MIAGLTCTTGCNAATAGELLPKGMATQSRFTACCPFLRPMQVKAAIAEQLPWSTMAALLEDPEPGVRVRHWQECRHATPTNCFLSACPAALPGDGCVSWSSAHTTPTNRRRQCSWCATWSTTRRWAEQFGAFCPGACTKRVPMLACFLSLRTMQPLPPLSAPAFQIANPACSRTSRRCCAGARMRCWRQ